MPWDASVRWAAVAMTTCALALPAVAGAQAPTDINVRIRRATCTRVRGASLYVYGYVRMPEGTDRSVRQKPPP